MSSAVAFRGDIVALEKWVKEFAKNKSAPHLFLLNGDLGAGKTTFVRFFLKAIANFERVESPTYSIIHRYDAISNIFFHADLYRINNKQDLDSTGFWDLFLEKSLVFVEWPGHLEGLSWPSEYKCSKIYIKTIAEDPSLREITVDTD